MIKKILALSLAVMLMFSVSAVDVGAFDTEIVTGCITVAGDMYESVSYTDVINFNVAPESYNGTPYSVDNEAKTLTLNMDSTNLASATANNNTDGTTAIDLSGINWINSGTITIAYDATVLEKPDGMTIYSGLIGKVHDSTGANKWPFGGTGNGMQTLIEGATFSSDAPVGTTVSVKFVYNFSPDGLVISAYRKSADDDDYTLISDTAAIKDGVTFTQAQYYIYKLVPYTQIRTVKGVAKVKYSNICITESYSNPMLEDISNNYLQTESKDVNYYIPEGYSTATLTLDGETIASFSAADDVAGSYKTTIAFSQFDIGNDIPLTLTVDYPEADSQSKTVYLNINAPITEPGVEDISGGRYSDVGTLTFAYEVPHEFGVAALKFNGEVVKSLSSDNGDKGGTFSESINIADYVQLGADEAERTVSVVLTVDGFTPVEREITVYKYYANAELEDVSGDYITTDSITFAYTLPTDYSTATLKLGDNVIDEFDCATTAGGKYSATVDLSDYDNLTAGNTVALTLTAEFENASAQIKTVNITLIETVTTPSLTGITPGSRYDHNGVLSFTYQVPHVYETAVLKIDDAIIREFNYADGDKGGTFEANINLADYVQLGENDLEDTFTVSLVVDDNAPIEVSIVLYKFYEDANLDNVSGYYAKADKVPFTYTLPTVYETATLKLGDNTLYSFTPDTKIGGVYADTLDLSQFDFGDETVSDVNLVLTVDDESITRELTVYNVGGFDVISVNSSNLKDDFDSSSSIFNTMNNGGVDTDTFKTTEHGNVYRFVFNVDKDTQSRGSFRSPDISVSKDYFVDISCDFYLTSPKMQLGLHLTTLSGATVLNWWMSNGVFMGNSANTYEAGRWYHLTQRIIPGHYTEDGKPRICWYVDGKSVGSAELAYDNSGLKMIALDVRNGSSMSANGPVYIDNLSYSQGAPRYEAELISVDGAGNVIDDVDYANPRIAIAFNQKMNAKSISTDTVKLTAFNGTVIESAITYDDSTSRIYIEPAEALVPGSEYTVTLSNAIKSMVSGGYDEDTEFVFVTKSQPVFMQAATPSAPLAEIPANTAFTVDVSVKNNSGASTTGYIYAAYYVGNQLQDISSVPVSGPTANQTYSMPLTTGASSFGDRRVVIYYTNGRNNFSAIDTFEIR